MKKCNDTRECFAQIQGKCTILTGNYPDGKCPFCKPDKNKPAIKSK